MTLDELLVEACKRAEEKEASPELFELKHLFDKKAWKALPRGTRTQLGIMFSTKVRMGQVPGIRYACEEITHHNLYIKLQ